MSPTSDPVWRWCDITWSPRLRPASAALLSGSTLSMKMRKPFSEPPSRVKDKGASLEGLVRVTTRSLALAAHAMFNSLRCPHIFWFKERHYMSCFAIDSATKQMITNKSKVLLHTTDLSIQIVLKLLEKMCHCGITLKVIEVIVHPQQDYPCNLMTYNVTNHSSHRTLIDLSACIRMSMYLVPEAGVMEPLQQFLAYHHGAWQESAVGKQEVLDISGVHHRVLFYKVHGKTLFCALKKKIIIKISSLKDTKAVHFFTEVSLL